MTIPPPPTHTAPHSAPAWSHIAHHAGGTACRAPTQPQVVRSLRHALQPLAAPPFALRRPTPRPRHATPLRKAAPCPGMSLHSAPLPLHTPPRSMRSRAAPWQSAPKGQMPPTPSARFATAHSVRSPRPSPPPYPCCRRIAPTPRKLRACPAAPRALYAHIGRRHSAPILERLRGSQAECPDRGKLPRPKQSERPLPRPPAKDPRSGSDP